MDQGHYGDSGKLFSEAANTQIIVKALQSSSAGMSDKVLLGSQGQVFGLGGNLIATTPTEH